MVFMFRKLLIEAFLILRHVDGLNITILAKLILLFGLQIQKLKVFYQLLIDFYHQYHSGLSNIANLLAINLLLSLNRVSYIIILNSINSCMSANLHVNPQTHMLKLTF